MFPSLTIPSACLCRCRSSIAEIRNRTLRAGKRMSLPPPPLPCRRAHAHNDHDAAGPTADLRRRRRLPGRCGRRGVQGAGVRGAEARGHAVPGPAGRPLGAAAKALLAGGLLREASGGPGRSDPEQHHTQSTLAHAHSTRRPVPSPLWAQGNEIWSILQYIPPFSMKKILRLTAAALRVRLRLRAAARG